MKNFLKIFGLVASLQLVAIQTLQAATLYVDPSTQSVTSGLLVSVDVNVGAHAGTQVGAYDFILTYDPGFLTFESLNFGSYLGYSTNSYSDAINDSILGELNILELSYLTNLSGQPTDSFTLFSVTFRTQSSGITNLGLIGNISGEFDPNSFLGDALGDSISLTDVTGASIDIQPRQQGNVPEPSSLLLMGLGLALLRWRSVMVAGR